MKVAREMTVPTARKRITSTAAAAAEQLSTVSRDWRSGTCWMFRSARRTAASLASVADRARATGQPTESLGGTQRPGGPPQGHEAPQTDTDRRCWATSEAPTKRAPVTAFLVGSTFQSRPRFVAVS